MTKIKTRATSFIDCKFNIARLHLLATVLNPKMKGLKMLPDSEKTAVYEDLRSRVEAIPIVTSTSNLSGGPIYVALKQVTNIVIFIPFVSC